MMKQRPLGGVRSFDDPVDACALEAMQVEFLEGGLEDFAAGICRRSGTAVFHITATRYRPVGMLSKEGFNFFPRCQADI
jgi:hypothetical protein